MFDAVIGQSNIGAASQEPAVNFHERHALRYLRRDFRRESCKLRSDNGN